MADEQEAKVQPSDYITIPGNTAQEINQGHRKLNLTQDMVDSMYAAGHGKPKGPSGGIDVTATNEPRKSIGIGGR